jgi:hypothetical protein
MRSKKPRGFCKPSPSLVAGDPQEALLLGSLVTCAVAQKTFLQFRKLQICGGRQGRRPLTLRPFEKGRSKLFKKQEFTK